MACDLHAVHTHVHGHLGRARVPCVPHASIACAQELRQLQQVVSTLDVESLSGCWDYISFPLLLIIDSISLCKVARPRPQQQPHGSSQPSSSTPPPEESPEPPVPAAKSDRVSEAVLDVLLALSQRVAQYVEADQAVEALQRLSPLLQLPRDTTSEEVRLICLTCGHTVSGCGSDQTVLLPPGAAWLRLTRAWLD